MDIDTLRVFSTKTAILRVNRPPAKPPPQKKEEPVSDGSEAGPGGKLLFYLYLSHYGYVVYLMAKDMLDTGEIAKLNVNDIEIGLMAHIICSKDRWLDPLMKEFIRIISDRG